MRFSGRRARWRALAWATPLVAAAAFVAAGPVAGALTGPASADLPARSAQQLLVDLQQADATGLSGTVQETADLGLPELPGSATDSSGLLGLLTGSHTLRVWHGGPQQARVAMPTQYGETDLVRNGRDAWLWTSADHTAQHWTLPAHRHGSGPALAQTPTTPQQAADEILKALSPTTLVTGAGTTTVADRPAYVLELQPRTAGTLVSSVQIAIDGQTHLPTQVQVFADGHSQPSFSVGFTSLDTGTPDPSTFDFTPPAGAVVQQRAAPRSVPRRGAAPPARSTARPASYGSGWSRVVVMRLPAQSDARTGTLGEMIDSLPAVSGAWGSGRLLQGPLMSAVLTSDGRIAFGAVPPARLYAALAR